MIPIQDIPGRQRRHFPAVTLTLIAANILVFLYELSLGSALPRFIQTYGMIPLEITTGEQLSPSSIPVYLTVITAMFLHGGVLHLGGNMLFLWIFGDNVEDTLGHLGYLGFYLLCGVAASVVQIFVNPTSTLPNIGASGAIAGVLGGYLLLFPNASVRTLLFIGPFITFTRLSAILMIGVWILFQVVSALVEVAAASGADAGGVAFWAHIGGFMAGVVVLGVWRVLTNYEPRAPAT
ncbi:MAG: rhomboid family intramembrane serine protease [Chloroflexota bacterium]